MAYATVSDVKKRMTRTMSNEEQAVCATLLEDVAILIDTVNMNASDDAKLVVSCRSVIRAMGDGTDFAPMGASQGSMSGLGYSQSWTMGTGGAVGELYLSKTDKQLLGAGNRIGSYSPTQEKVWRMEE